MVFAPMLLLFFAFSSAVAEEQLIREYSHEKEKENDLSKFHLAQIVPPAKYKVIIWWGINRKETLRNFIDTRNSELSTNHRYAFTFEAYAHIYGGHFAFFKNLQTVESDEMGQFLLKKEAKISSKILKIPFTNEHFNLNITPMKERKNEQQTENGEKAYAIIPPAKVGDAVQKVYAQTTSEPVDRLCHFSEQRRCLVHYFETVPDLRDYLDSVLTNCSTVPPDRTVFFVMATFRHAINQAKKQMKIGCKMEQRDAIVLGKFSNVLAKASKSETMLAKLSLYGDKFLALIDELCEIEIKEKNFLTNDQQFEQQLESIDAFGSFCAQWKQNLRIKMVDNQQQQLNVVDSSSTTNLCAVCLEEKRKVFFKPCNHLATCEKCAEQFKVYNSKCPFCRGKIDGKVSISNNSPAEYCTNCWSDEPRVLFMPCRHFCTCEMCAKAVMDSAAPKCPICDGKVEQTMRIFNP